MLQKQLKLKIAYGAVVVFTVLYAAAVFIYLGVKYGAGEVISNFFGVACICAAFVGVTIFSYFLAKNYVNGKRKKAETVSNEETKEQLPAKKRISDFVIMTVCLGISAVLIAWAVTGFGTFAGLGDVLGGGYTKTQATIVRLVSENEDFDRLVYEYVAADGKVYQSVSDASFGGIIFETGRQVTIYYFTEAPQIAVNISTSLILLLGAAMFLFGGIGWVSAGGSHKRSQIMGFSVFTFFVVFGVVFYVAGWLASGLHVYELCMSGAAYYGITIFMLIGIVLDVLGIVSTIKNLKKGKAEKDEQDDESLENHN